MADVTLTLPQRSSKPRSGGLTMMIDKGLSSREFEDLIESHGEHVDFVKFGWGTSVVTKNFQTKLDVLRNAASTSISAARCSRSTCNRTSSTSSVDLCEGYGCSFVEVSNGTIDITNDDKAEYVKRLSEDFFVISEVGSKDQATSDLMAPQQVGELHSSGPRRRRGSCHPRDSRGRKRRNLPVKRRAALWPDRRDPVRQDQPRRSCSLRHPRLSCRRTSCGASDLTST